MWVCCTGSTRRLNREVDFCCCVWRSPGSNLRPLVYKASDLTTAPRRLRFFCVFFFFVCFSGRDQYFEVVPGAPEGSTGRLVLVDVFGEARDRTCDHKASGLSTAPRRQSRLAAQIYRGILTVLIFQVLKSMW